MKKIKSVVFILVLVVFWILLFVPNSFAGEQELKYLDFSVELTENGDMNVTENWRVKLSDTNTLFKTFKYDTELFTNVSILETTNGARKEFQQIDSLMYHVTKDCFYALKNSDGLFEIAWGVSATSTEIRNFEISYTVKDIIKKYNDCSELYWQFVGYNFSIPADTVSGTIKLPKQVDNIEDLKIWAHGPLNGNITKPSLDTVKFEVTNLRTSDYLEVRIATPNNIFPLSTNEINSSKLENIISEETNWANKANLEREKAREEEAQQKRMFYGIYAILTVACVVLNAVNIRKIQNTSKIVPSQKLDYFRDIPDEKSTPGEAAFLYYFNRSFPTAQVVSATMMDLALKGFIEFETNPNNKKDVNIILKNEVAELKRDEIEVLNYLKRVAGSSDKFNMKVFEKYSNSHPSIINDFIMKINMYAKDENEDSGMYDRTAANKSSLYIVKAVAIVFGMFFASTFLVAFVDWLLLAGLGILAGILAVLYIILANKNRGLTQEGTDRREEWKGLKNYMEDFSMLNEREVPELVLWEKYLVYATAFGIADKVIKQLKVRYPEMVNNDYFNDRMHVMYVMSNVNISSAIEAPISRSIVASSINSSGSGGGGGFSSGGGSFGGGGAGGGGGGGR